MAGPLDSCNEHPLMPGARPCDAFRNNPALLRHETLKFLFGLVIDKIFLVVAEAASALFSDLSR